MVRELVGNLLPRVQDYDLIVIPCNGILNSACALTMGAGAAAACAKFGPWPNLGLELGVSIVRAAHTVSLGRNAYFYNFVRCEVHPNVAALQTKMDWKDKSELPIIELAIDEMLDQVGCVERVAVFYPGIGKGGLSREEVQGVVSKLPNNYDVWRTHQ